MAGALRLKIAVSSTVGSLGALPLCILAAWLANQGQPPKKTRFGRLSLTAKAINLSELDPNLGGNVITELLSLGLVCQLGFVQP